MNETGVADGSVEVSNGTYVYCWLRLHLPPNFEDVVQSTLPQKVCVANVKVLVKRVANVYGMVGVLLLGLQKLATHDIFRGQWRAQWLAWCHVALDAFELLSRNEQQKAYVLLLSESDTYEDVLRYDRVTSVIHDAIVDGGLSWPQLPLESERLLKPLITKSLNRFISGANVREFHVCMLRSPHECTYRVVRAIAQGQDMSSLLNFLVGVDLHEKPSSSRQGVSFSKWSACHRRGTALPRVLLSAILKVISDVDDSSSSIRAMRELICHCLPSLSLREWLKCARSSLSRSVCGCSFCECLEIGNEHNFGVDTLRFKGCSSCEFRLMSGIMLLDPVEVIQLIVVPKLRIDTSSRCQRMGADVLLHILRFMNQSLSTTCSHPLLTVPYSTLVVSVAYLLSCDYDADIETVDVLKQCFTLLLTSLETCYTSKIDQHHVQRMHALAVRLMKDDMCWRVQVLVVGHLYQLFDKPSVRSYERVVECELWLRHLFRVLIVWISLHDSHAQRFSVWLETVRNTGVRNDDCIHGRAQYRLDGFAIASALDNSSVESLVVQIPTELHDGVALDLRWALLSKSRDVHEALVVALSDTLGDVTVDEHSRIVHHFLFNLQPLHKSACVDMASALCTHHVEGRDELLMKSPIFIVGTLMQSIVLMLWQNSLPTNRQRHAVECVSASIDTLCVNHAACAFVLCVWGMRLATSRRPLITSTTSILHSLIALATQLVKSHQLLLPKSNIVCHDCVEMAKSHLSKSCGI